MENEIWKDVVGYEGFYQISNTGRVLSFAKNNLRFLKIRITKFGYCTVALRKPKTKQRHFFIHRLVAESFMFRPVGKTQINHINGDKTDNKIGNLEWVTQSENLQHAFRTGLKSADSTKIKLESFDISGRFVKDYNSYSEAAKDIGVSQPAISNAIRRGNRCKGLKFSVKEIKQ